MCSEMWRTVVSLALPRNTFAEFVENTGANKVIPHATTCI